MKRIRVIGVGGAGLNAVYRLAERGFTDAELFAVDVDRHPDDPSGHSDNFYDRLRALLTPEHVLIMDAGDAETPAGELIRRNRIRLLKFVEGAKAVVVVCGLGGLTGGPAAVTLCRMAREVDMPVASVVIIPFSAEGKGRRAEEAIRQAEDICRESDITVMLKNDFLLKVAPREPLNVAFGHFDDAVRWVTGYLGRLIL